MKTNTMLAPETLTPLADADLQKWCERTVSYTHLDVYKRQMVYSVCLIVSMDKLMIL